MSDPLDQSERYRVVRRLAVGGMGEVLLARFGGDEELEPGLIVLKRTLPDHPNRTHQNDMLREEARVALRLRHENLVETFRLDEQGSDPLVVMEYLAGRSIAQVLGAAKRNQEPLPFVACVKVLRSAACGLHFAHTLRDHERPLGIVHRDVSPANLFVTFDGRCKVIDFGVAKADDSAIQTSTGILKGKIGYMSPEHAQGTKLDARSDLWSLGVVFWEMLVADRLFSGPNPALTLHHITHGDIPALRSRRPDIPRPLEELCMCLLVRDRKQRVQSAAELVRLIDQLPLLEGDGDLGAFLSVRFPEEAEQGRREAYETARLRQRGLIPSGLVDGGAFMDVLDEPADGAPTQVMDSAELIALAHGGQPSPTLEDLADAPTAIVPAGAELGLVSGSGLLSEPEPLGMPPTAHVAVGAFEPRPDDERPLEPETQAPPRPASLGDAAPTVPGMRKGSISGPTPSAPAGLSAQPSVQKRKTPPSAWSVAIATFGAIAMLMGVVFAFLVEQRVVTPRYYAIVTDQALIVVARRQDLPSDVPPEQAGQLDPEKPPPEIGIDPARLRAELETSGVLARARLPRTPRARLAAALPVGIVVLGLFALALSLPGFAFRGAAGVAWGLRVLLSVLVLGGGAFVAEVGGLGWPGLAALEEPLESPRATLPLPGAQGRDAPPATPDGSPATPR